MEWFHFQSEKEGGRRLNKSQFLNCDKRETNSFMPLPSNLRRFLLNFFSLHANILITIFQNLLNILLKVNLMNLLIDNYIFKPIERVNIALNSEQECFILKKAVNKYNWNICYDPRSFSSWISAFIFFMAYIFLIRKQKSVTLEYLILHLLV